MHLHLLQRLRGRDTDHHFPGVPSIPGAVIVDKSDAGECRLIQVDFVLAKDPQEDTDRNFAVRCSLTEKFSFELPGTRALPLIEQENKTRLSKSKCNR